MPKNAKPTLDAKMLEGLLRMEGPIGELSNMAQIAKVFIADQPFPPDIFEARRAADCAALLALRVAKMVKGLEAAFYAACEIKCDPEEA